MLFHELVPTILGQRITAGEAIRQWHRLCRKLGEPAPGPHPGPACCRRRRRRWLGRPAWWFHPLGVEAKRAEALRAVGKHAEKLWALGATSAGRGRRQAGVAARRRPVDDRVGHGLGDGRSRRRRGRRLPPQERRVRSTSPASRVAPTNGCSSCSRRTPASAAGSSGCCCSTATGRRRSAPASGSCRWHGGDPCASVSFSSGPPGPSDHHMTETLGPQLAAVDDTSATWYRILRKVGLVYLFSRLCVLAGAAIVAAELQADINQTKGVAGVPFADPHIAGRPVPTSALGPISRRAVVVGRPLVPAHRPRRLSAPRSTARHLLRRRRPRRVLPRVPDAGQRRRQGACRAATRSPRCSPTSCSERSRSSCSACWPRQLYGEQVAAKAMVLGAMFPGSFVLSFAYTEALLLVFAMGCLWCLMSQRWVAGRAARRARHRDAAQRTWRWCWPVRSPRSSPFDDDRDWRSLAAPLLAPLGLRRLPTVARSAHRRGRRVVPRAERGVGRGRQLRADRDTQDLEAFAHPADFADQRHHRGIGDGDAADDLLRCGASACPCRWWRTSPGSSP